MRFQHKVVIVTGGASGIGATTARLFAEEGAKVVIADYSDKGREVSRTLNEKGLDSFFVQTDVSNEDAVIRMVGNTVRRYGRLDVLFANAGVASDGPTDQIDYEVWQKTIQVNLSGVFLCNKHAIKQMLAQGEGGSIVNCGSVHSFVGKARVAAYASAKGGVHMLTRSSAAAYAANGIRVNTVCPGYIETSLISGLKEEMVRYLQAQHPIGRMGTTEEVGKAVLFLASEDASFITGASLLVDGGYTAV
ncbi:SDR family oxidoreductase [Paenibacillus hemerocallicola]|uniref:SDR family oxidoreductase n=1 Tax=Paenibacillus hemerocallicola TaxID=1172614 RepID=A0A5C4SVE6_9BACL|nr:SDR family oxidoreductase [Paenibacillus hemerocallicola]TNJ55783.1 SDR family oxidoreductase [Paenibacillus hemerocallicola]